MTTERLFDQDPYQSTFQASVLLVEGDPAHPRVVLDRTLFFPRSGGQESDRGWIDSVPVSDVYEDGEAVVHVLDGPLDLRGPVEGKIDWDRRFYHMQQHTGQHILSQAFWRHGQVKTVGFHLGDKDSTIDLQIQDLTSEHVMEIENAVNRVVFENRNVSVVGIPYEELDVSLFRKKPAQRTLVRVVDVEGYDRSGCCGTHVRRTGEVGLIKIQRWERYKGNVRVTFVCGQRALQDYRMRMGVLNQVCRTLTAGEDEIQKRLDRLLGEHHSAVRRLKTMNHDLAVFESGTWTKAGTDVGPYRLFSRVFENRDPELILGSVKKTVEQDGWIVLVGLKGDIGHFFFARSPSVSLDVRPLLDTACLESGGKGGGTPSMAQGKTQDTSRMEASISRAVQQVRLLLKES